MRTEIKWRKSIQKNRLIYEKNLLESILDWLISALFTLSIPLCIYMVTPIPIGDTQASVSWGRVAISYLIGTGIALLFLYRYTTALHVTRICGLSPEENRRIINGILKELQWPKMYDNKNFLVSFPPTFCFSWGHQVTLLYDKNDILISSITFGRHGIISPFSIIGDSMRKNEIVSRFETICSGNKTNDW